MAMYVYQTDGSPVGFRFNNCIHDLSGAPLGRVLGTHVYRFDGSYVGELFKDMVVDKPSPHTRPILPIDPPPAADSPGIGNPRRGVVDYGYPDVFHLLGEARAPGDRLGDPLALAAE